MIPSFAIDPYLTALPENGLDTDLRNWLLALETWLRETDVSPYFWGHLHECSLKLLEQGRLPSFVELKKLSSELKSDINTGWLSRKMNTFFQDPSRSITTNLSITDCLASGPVSISPAEFKDRSPSTAEELAQGFLKIAIAKNAQNGFAQSIVVVTAAFQVEPSSSIHVSANVDIIEPPPISPLNNPVTSSIPVLFSPDEIIPILLPSQLLGGDGHDFIRAINIAARQFNTQPLNFTLHSNFLPSIRGRSIASDNAALEKLIRTCASVILNQAKDLKLNLRPLRKSETADSPQRTRDGDKAKAWRLTVTKNGVGWRMQYWHIPPASPEQLGTIQFANVLGKQEDETIPE
ncbi:hypothetical protein [Corallococcus exercitus]|uniref:Uncharacterized protein n=1 Tax=Corallococcus exercitus TaxID=2316736 RepID=A0A7Y4JNE0_9BACT|nr:hypothetical protein [Corallococcus exercitus]NOK08151.1 hypothetical protein [Corallococcus exercitus]